jgi:hypothetical protein
MKIFATYILLKLHSTMQIPLTGSTDNPVLSLSTNSALRGRSSTFPSSAGSAKQNYTKCNNSG